MRPPRDLGAGLAPLSNPAEPAWLLPGQRFTPADRLIAEFRSLQAECEKAMRWITAAQWQHAGDLAEAILRADPGTDFDPTASDPQTFEVSTPMVNP